MELNLGITLRGHLETFCSFSIANELQAILTPWSHKSQKKEEFQSVNFTYCYFRINKASHYIIFRLNTVLNFFASIIDTTNKLR